LRKGKLKNPIQTLDLTRQLCRVALQRSTLSVIPKLCKMHRPLMKLQVLR